MTRTLPGRRLLMGTTALLPILGPLRPVAAQQAGGPAIEVERAWTRATGPTAQTAVA
jgi:copper(I)-binding protein